MKILLVDDEKKFAMMLSKRLALRGIEVDYVHTAKEAVAKVESNNYDVAILDVKMPGIGGIELERKLKAMVPGMKCIFLTGHGSEADFTAGSAKAAYYLAKPLQIDELVEILHELAE
ncbi:MAG: response regulator [Desulfobacterales bacterium]|jgi:DNA-binding response OmpR family regulator